MLNKIDNWLFEVVYQPITNWFTIRTGRSNYWLAGTTTLLYGALCITQRIMIPEDTSYFSFGFKIFFVIFLSLRYELLDKKTKSSTTRNPERISSLNVFVRKFSIIVMGTKPLAIILCVSLDAKWITSLIILITLVSIIYFEGCDTLPPPPPKSETKIAVVTTT